MNIENLDLLDFDINTHEPPNYGKNFISLESESKDTEDSENIVENSSDTEEEEHQNIKSTLENEDLEINLENIENNDEFDLEECDNVIYSYPFFSKDNIDYEYRVTITDEELLLEQVKCDDSQLDFNDCVEVFAEIYRGDLVPTFELIQKNIDLRDQSKILQEGIIDYNFDEKNKEKLIAKIENNKISALFELYKEIVDSVYE